MADDFKDVKLFLLNDSRSTRGENHHAHLNKEESSEGDRDHPPEARPHLLLILELVIQDEKESDRQIEQDQNDLNPAIEEARS